MNSPVRAGFGHPGTRLLDVQSELIGVQRLLHKLRHNRGRWPKVWTKGMLAHYEEREAKLKGTVSRLQRAK